MRTPYKKHCNHLVGGLLAVLLLAAIFNLLVDPFYYFGTGLTCLSAGRTMRDRRPKAHLLRRGDCEIMLMGSSRVETGLDPQHPAWHGKRVYNLGMNRHSAAEMVHILDYGLRQNAVKEVWLCTDFFAFNSLGGVSDDFDPDDYCPSRALKARQSAAHSFACSRFNPELSPVGHAVNMLIGRDSISESLKVVKRVRRGEPMEYTDAGFRLPADRSDAPRRLFADALTNYMTWSSLYGNYQMGDEHLAAVREILQMCRAREIRVYVVMLPIHALQMEAIDGCGLWPLFEEWKRAITALVDEAADQAAVPLELWDFQGYSSFTMEPVPLDPSVDATMLWFWESSHCTRELGNLIIQSVKERKRRGEPATFGRRLQAVVLADHLDDLRAGRALYRAANPDQIAFFREVADEVLPRPGTDRAGGRD